MMPRYSPEVGVVKTVIQMMVGILLVIVIAIAHPFQLAMPWQSGNGAEVEFELLDIMSRHRFELVETDVGRLTLFHYRAAESVYRTSANPAETCSALRQSLDDWGRNVELVRRVDGCDIEATGAGPMTATVRVTENPEHPRDLRVEVRVQHRP